MLILLRSRGVERVVAIRTGSKKVKSCGRDAKDVVAVWSLSFLAPAISFSASTLFKWQAGGGGEGQRQGNPLCTARLSKQVSDEIIAMSHFQLPIQDHFPAIARHLESNVLSVYVHLTE